MAARLAKVNQVETVTLRVVNTILRVEQDRVWVCSAKTGNERAITFAEIRNWSKGRHNSCIRLALAVELGLTPSSGMNRFRP
mgnify:CR=1 FL=1